MRHLVRQGALIFLICAGVIAPTGAQGEEPWPVRLREPRIAPLPEANWGEVERSILLPEGGRQLRLNIFTTLVRHPGLIAAWGPFGRYALEQSELPAKEREILILRIGWLCQSGYEWGQHVRIGLLTGLTTEEVHRIAEGPEAEGWSDFERTLLRAADELHYEAVLSDESWDGLREQYTLEQTLDAILTVGEYKLVCMALNSLGVQLDASVIARLPTDVERPEPAGRPTLALPGEARVEPLPREDWSEDQQALLQPFARGDEVSHGMATFIRHPSAFAAAIPFQSYLMTASSLSEPVRFKVMLRVYYLTRCDYEWIHLLDRGHGAGLTEADLEMLRRPDAGEDHLLIRAVDQLLSDAFIDEATWEALAKTLDTPQLFDLIFTTGGANIAATIINSLGVELEPGLEIH